MYTTEIELENFLEEYKRSRVIIESSVRAILNKFLEFEEQFQKPFYEFSEEDALSVFTSFHAISIVSLQNSNLLIKHFARWIIDKKDLNIKSAYENICKDQLLGCIDIQKKNSLIITKDDLEEMQKQLLNWTDKAILGLLFLGFGGKWLRELTFFSTEQISKKEGVAYLRTGKIIPVTEEDYQLIKNACDEDELISFGSTMKVSKVRNLGIYKNRFNALSDNSNPNDEQDVSRRYRWVQRRIMLISNDLGVALTSGQIQMSGLLHYLKQGVEESGMTFREYTKTDDAINLAKRYDIFSFAPQILVEKFEEYFQ